MGRAAIASAVTSAGGTVASLESTLRTTLMRPEVALEVRARRAPLARAHLGAPLARARLPQPISQTPFADPLARPLHAPLHS